MNNAEKFEQVFGMYATELWSMSEGDFLEWLNRDVETMRTGECIEIIGALPMSNKVLEWPEQQWTFCSKKLPDEDEDVLFAVEWTGIKGNLHYYMAVGYRVGMKAYIGDDVTILPICGDPNREETVIAWMPRYLHAV